MEEFRKTLEHSDKTISLAADMIWLALLSQVLFPEGTCLLIQDKGIDLREVTILVVNIAIRVRAKSFIKEVALRDQLLLPPRIHSPKLDLTQDSKKTLRVD